MKRSAASSASPRRCAMTPSTFKASACPSRSLCRVARARPFSALAVACRGVADDHVRPGDLGQRARFQLGVGMRGKPGERLVAVANRLARHVVVQQAGELDQRVGARRAGQPGQPPLQLVEARLSLRHGGRTEDQQDAGGVPHLPHCRAPSPSGSLSRPGPLHTVSDDGSVVWRIGTALASEESKAGRRIAQTARNWSR